MAAANNEREKNAIYTSKRQKRKAARLANIQFYASKTPSYARRLKIKED